MDLQILAERLRTAREQRGITQQAAALALNLPRTAITQIEGGNRAVSTLELTRLAKLYSRAVSSFVDEIEEIDEELDVILYRTEPGLKEIPAIKRYLNLCSEGLLLEKILGQIASLGLPTYNLPSPRNKSEAVQQGEIIAKKERKRLDIGSNPVADIADLIARQGIWAASTNLPDTMSGLFWHHQKTGLVILVNAKHTKARKRFSYAHEYAHALIDREGFVRISHTDNNAELIEVRANAFAAAFLMPAEGITDQLRALNKGQPSRNEYEIFDVVTGGKTKSENRTLASNQHITYQDVILIAHHFGVSYQATVYRLSSLRFLSQQEKTALLAKEHDGKNYLRRLDMFTDFEEQEDQKLWDRELRSQLVRLAIEAYRQQEISRGRLLELGNEIGIDGKVLYDLAEAALDND